MNTIKVQWFLLGILLGAMVLVGCGSEEPIIDPPLEEEEQQDEEPKEEEEVHARDFFPIILDHVMIYEGEGGEYVEEKIFYDYYYEDQGIEWVQRRRETSGTTVLEVLQIREEGVAVIYQSEGHYKKESVYAFDKEEVPILEWLLKSPIEAGSKWEHEGESRREITGVEVEIETPLGTLKALEVTTYYEEDYLTRDYYAREYGWIKSSFLSGELLIEKQLKEIKSVEEETEAFRFYYPDFENARLVYIDKSLSLSTNEAIEEVISEYFRRVPFESEHEIIPLMAEEGKLLSIRLDHEATAVYVDFNKAFLEKMNAGAELERMILESVKRTIQSNYHQSKVGITLEGEPYQSGHYYFERGETLDSAPVYDEEEHRP